MMKHLFFALMLGVATQSCAQSPAPDQQQPPARQAQPQQTPAQQPQAQEAPTEYASKKEGWLVDLDEAYEISTKTGKPILANFTGSDWCGWCKRLDADVFSKPDFQEWAKKNVVLLELDFPRRFQIPAKNRQQNAAMQQALKITGYPTIWVLTLTKDEAKGTFQVNPMGKTGYNPSSAEFIAIVDKYIHP